MYKTCKIIATTIALAGFASVAHAGNQGYASVYAPTAPQTQQAATTRKTTRIVRRVEHKYVASKAVHDKHLVRLNANTQGYGKVIVPTQSRAKTPNLYRP